jgi:hypothetical protein
MNNKQRINMIQTDKSKYNNLLYVDNNKERRI